LGTPYISWKYDYSVKKNPSSIRTSAGTIFCTKVKATDNLKEIKIYLNRIFPSPL